MDWLGGGWVGSVVGGLGVGDGWVGLVVGGLGVGGLVGWWVGLLGGGWVWE